MYAEEELLPISALQHLLFCERRATLILLDGLWDDNVYTVQGAELHEQVHGIEREARGETRITRGLLLRSLRLGLSGKADVVEFHRLDVPDAQKGVAIPGATGLWQPVPVEYKRGRLRSEESYEVQLCAQALCLEEMLHIKLSSGALFYGKSKRRLEIAFSEDLRQQTEAAAARLHELIGCGKTPEARRDCRCKSCSLSDLCLPAVTRPRHSAKRYLEQSLAKMDGNEL
jgi:CRISPR-associated exonuclease Cas4